MTEPFRILTVCVGNICRSPLAERLLRLRLAPHVQSGQVVIESAGVGAVVGHEMDDLAEEQLHRLGGSGEGFVARQITTPYVVGADLVLTATVDIRARALREGPSAMKRTFTLGEFAAICDLTGDPAIATRRDLVSYGSVNRPQGTADLDVRDPIGRDDALHRAVADQIDGYVTTIANRLSPLI